MVRYQHAVIFDLDGVLTDTAELHYQSWRTLAQGLGLSFDRSDNEALRGVSREESLRRFLGSHFQTFTQEQRADLLFRKNEDYLERVAQLSRADVFPGVERLLGDLESSGFGRAIASSSRNARVVLERLGIGDAFEVIIDGNDAPRSKPDPLAFLLAAARLNVPAPACVVVEDAQSGVDAARQAGMKVIGVGSPGQLAAADLVVPATGGLTPRVFADLLGLAVA
jgi:beta-phosphoglucomutase